MKKFGKFICLISFYILFCAAAKKDFSDVCDRCVEIEQCPWFANLNKHEQDMWSKRIPCNQQSSFGFSPTTKIHYVCCPEENIWNKEDMNNRVKNVSNNYDKLAKLEIVSDTINLAQKYYSNLHSQLGNSNVSNEQPIIDNQNLHSYQQNEKTNHTLYTINNVKHNLKPRHGQEMNERHQTKHQTQGTYNTNQNRPVDPNYQSTGGNIWNIDSGPQRSWRNTNPGNQYSGENTKQIGIQPGVQNPWPNNKQASGTGVQITNTYSQQYIPNYNYNGNANSFRTFNRGDICEVQRSLLPDPGTGCCGQDTSGVNSIADLQYLLNIYALSNRQSQPSPEEFYQIQRFSQKQEATVTNNTGAIQLETRIAGGEGTELEQFPWTTLLESLFDNDYQQTTISCGGSLISSRFVLTAGHCIYVPNTRLLRVQIILAEYDKTTFPRDCVAELGMQLKCIDNVLMQALNVILHPEYDSTGLQNDIALIRLEGYAPHTRYIRPICLPPINIDNNNFLNLPLAAVGWGLNGPYTTDIKQSTVLRLIPHNECQKYYPYLSDSHLCAAGRTGEDTCRGDSGGPLMMLFRGSYYVVGVVSGKRGDAPCGTSIPSLYTNVFRYVTWINNTISN